MELLKRFSLRPNVAIFAFLTSVRRPWGHRLPFKLKHISIVVYAYDLPVQYRMRECVVHRGIKTVGRELSWCRLNSEYHKALASFFNPS